MLIFIAQHSAISTSKLETSLQSGNHQKLSSLIGAWEGVTKTWFEPGDPVDESPVSGVFKPLFDGRFVMHEYQGTFQGKPFEGIAIYGYFLMTGKFQSVWMDTFHMGTGFMLSEGEANDPSVRITGNFQASAEDSARWSWRTEIEWEGENDLIITAYNITPAGEETKALETRYHRK